VLVELTVVEQRYDAVKEVIAQGLTVTEVAAATKCPGRPFTSGWPGTGRAASERWPTGLTDPRAAPTRWMRRGPGA
jgi:hypothetical protein